MTGGRNVGEIRHSAEDAKAFAGRSERSIHGRLCCCARTGRILASQCGTLSTRRSAPRLFPAGARQSLKRYRFNDRGDFLPSSADLPLSNIQRGKKEPPSL